MKLQIVCKERKMVNVAGAENDGVYLNGGSVLERARTLLLSNEIKLVLLKHTSKRVCIGTSNEQPKLKTAMSSTPTPCAGCAAVSQ